MIPFCNELNYDNGFIICGNTILKTIKWKFWKNVSSDYKSSFKLVWRLCQMPNKRGNRRRKLLLPYGLLFLCKFTTTLNYYNTDFLRSKHLYFFFCKLSVFYFICLALRFYNFDMQDKCHYFFCTLVF